MKILSHRAALAALASLASVPIAAHAEVAVAPQIAEGRMVYNTAGQRLAPIYRVNADGSVQLIVDGRLLTLSPAILSDVNGKLTSATDENDLPR